MKLVWPALNSSPAPCCNNCPEDGEGTTTVVRLHETARGALYYTTHTKYSDYIRVETAHVMSDNKLRKSTQIFFTGRQQSQYKFYNIRLIFHAES